MDNSLLKIHSENLEMRKRSGNVSKLCSQSSILRTVITGRSMKNSATKNHTLPFLLASVIKENDAKDQNCTSLVAQIGHA
jgi:hypothetical protein